jgi:hypothetical protein
MSDVVDPTVTEHKPIFPAVVAIICAFAGTVFFAFTLLGLAIGAAFKR